MDQKQTMKNKILSYFRGNLNVDEEFELLQWIKEDSGNKKYFLEFKNRLNPDQVHHDLLSGSYSELRSKLFINEQFKFSQSRKTRKLYVQISKIAAILLLVLSLGFSLGWLIMDHQQKEVVWFEANAPRGEKTRLTLPDGSKVWLNSESTLSFPNDFLEGNREVKLTGEAYFEVEKMHGLPFIVKTEAYDVRVLGTKFNVTAYKDFNRTVTSLIEGHVQILKGQQTVDLKPGQMLTYQNKRFLVKETNTIRASSWKDDKFDFDHVTFKELMIRLERWYDVDIKMDDPSLNDIVFSGVFKNEETIWQVLNSIQVTLPIKYYRSGFREFVIERK